MKNTQATAALLAILVILSLGLSAERAAAQVTRSCFSYNLIYLNRPCVKAECKKICDDEFPNKVINIDCQSGNICKCNLQCQSRKMGRP